MSSTKKLYGIDLDGICFDFGGAFNKWLSEHTDLDIPPMEEITSYYWYENVDGLSDDVFWDEFHKFGKADGYFALSLIPGAREGLFAIRDAGHDIMYITNRPDYAQEQTTRALFLHGFPNPDKLVLAHGAKAPVIREHGVDVFIDDSPRTIAEICANTEAKIYCMDYPFNRDIHDVHNYTRVRSWSEFLRSENITDDFMMRL